MDSEEIKPYFDLELSAKVKNAFDLQNNPGLVNDCKINNVNDASGILSVNAFLSVFLAWMRQN